MSQLDDELNTLFEQLNIVQEGSNDHTPVRDIRITLLYHCNESAIYEQLRTHLNALKFQYRGSPLFFDSHFVNDVPAWEEGEILQELSQSSIVLVLLSYSMVDFLWSHPKINEAVLLKGPARFSIGLLCRAMETRTIALGLLSPDPFEQSLDKDTYCVNITSWFEQVLKKIERECQKGRNT